MSRDTLAPARLYGILDLGYLAPDALVSAAGRMIAGGIDVLQLRAKNSGLRDIESWAKQLVPVCRDGGVPLIVNDHPAVAVASGADGVHVGQDDLSMDDVRRVTGDDLLVGRSTHSLQQAAESARDSRTDYIGFGPLFSTPTKPDYRAIGTEEIRAVHDAHPGLPIFCIGGIKRENLREVAAAVAERAVIVSGILQAEDIETYVRECRRILSSPRN